MRILGLLLLALALGLFALFRPPPATTAGAVPVAAAPDLWRVPTGPEPESGAVAVIARRPLFEPRRRPPAPQRTEEAAPDPPRVRVSAVTVSSDVRVAVIEDLDSGRTRRVREGEALNQWTIKRVYPDRIVLQWKGRETTREATIPLLRGE